MKKPFREHHLLLLLAEYEKSSAPLDRVINLYFRSRKALGSKDRAYIAETAYFLMRWAALLDFHSHSSTWESRLDVSQTLDIEEAIKNNEIPPHTRASFPKELYQKILESHPENGHELCLISNEKAPTTVRVNLLKTTRDELLERWSKKYDVVPCTKSETGITFKRRENFFQLPEFKEGHFEVQDEGSQLLAHLIDAKPGDHILDFCAGSGGKTLAIAPKMGEKGQLWLHDIRPWALDEAKKRLRRAGVQNSQILLPDSPNIKKLKGKCDYVLVDAPCSGTGTLRRNPDMKWKYSDEMVERLIGQQRTIFEKALSYLKPSGRIVYGTCSLLKQENQEQRDHFLETYPLQQVGDEFISLPTKGGMDGFYGVSFEK